MLVVNSFNLLQSFNYTHYLFYKKRFKTETNCFCIQTLKGEGGTKTLNPSQEGELHEITSAYKANLRGWGGGEGGSPNNGMSNFS
jgi:hypothetical protein